MFQLTSVFIYLLKKTSSKQKLIKSFKKKAQKYPKMQSVCHGRLELKNCSHLCDYEWIAQSVDMDTKIRSPQNAE